MQVKLKLVKGSDTDKEITVKGPEFVIGRSDECQLRPKSDAVSRRHCAIRVLESGVTIRDLGSRNGTYVNGDRIDGEQPVSMGDQLRVGPLDFLVIVSGVKREQLVTDAKLGRSSNDSDIISQWLEEADAAERDERMSDPETRQFKLDETDRVELEAAAQEVEAQNDKKKKEPGKLPTPPPESDSTKDSTEAAAKMLKKFFNRTG